MIPVEEIRSRAVQWSVPENVVEKDYVFGWILWGIGSNPTLSRSWAFRGGACIKKCYVDTHRYSDDLDFTVLPGTLFDPNDLSSIFADILDKVSAASEIDFRAMPPRFEERSHGGSIWGKVYFKGLLSSRQNISVKLDIVHREYVIYPTVLREVVHPYSDELPASKQIRCYDLHELFAEKIRAMGERCRPRDLYDITYLFRRSDLHIQPDLIRSCLQAKCEAKNVEVPTYDAIQHSVRRLQLESEWHNMLGHQVGPTVPFENHWSRLPSFFQWLNNEPIEDELPLLEIHDEEMWHPPTLSWTRGETNLLEPIRFAAVNQLCINLGYGGRFRIVEPYSFRRARNGAVLFYALKLDDRSHPNAYRLDRIQSVKVIPVPLEDCV